MCGEREPARVDPDLGDDDLSAEVLDARDRYYLLDCGAKGLEVRLHLGVKCGHGGIDCVDLIEMKAQQEAMVFRHAAAPVTPSLAGGAAAWPLAARAQQPAMPVIGYLRGGKENGVPRLAAAFGQGLGEQGYVEGRNVEILDRWMYTPFTS
jgi:hypothetical protein